MTGTIISTVVLILLPELLRSLQDYRMLIYAVVLILVMLVTNNPILKSGWDLIRDKLTFWKKRDPVLEAEGGGGSEQ